MRLRAICFLLAGVSAVPGAVGATEDKWSIEPSISGGFTAIKVAEVLKTTNLVCNTASPPVCSEDATRVTLRVNRPYEVQPAPWFGLNIRRLIPKIKIGEETFGIGLGGNVILAKRPDDLGQQQTKIYPGLGLTVGTAKFHLIAGLMFAPSDEVKFPNDSDQLVVPADTNLNGFVTRRSGKGPAFFFGIAVGGVAADF